MVLAMHRKRYTVAMETSTRATFFGMMMVMAIAMMMVALCGGLSRLPTLDRQRFTQSTARPIAVKCPIQ
jgi:hypothetical protein